MAAAKMKLSFQVEPPLERPKPKRRKTIRVLDLYNGDLFTTKGSSPLVIFLKMEGGRCIVFGTDKYPYTKDELEVKKQLVARCDNIYSDSVVHSIVGHLTVKDESKPKKGR